MPCFAFFLADIGGNLAWERYVVTTEDGYELSLVRISGDENGDPVTDVEGPMLFLHGLFEDGLAWFDINNPTDIENGFRVNDASMPSSLQFKWLVH